MAKPAQDCDVLIVGGGIHGVGAAQAAAGAGYRVILLEQSGLADGTSSRSSKLIHGGLRYLESADFALVRESLRERELLLKLAPELVKRQKFFIPIYPETSRRPWILRIGLSFYALLAGLGEFARYRSVPATEWGDLDGLEMRNLQRVYQYWDAQTDDARLTRAVMASAEQMGARLICPARFESARIEADRCVVQYEVNGEVGQCTSLVVVNAAGPWANSVAGGFTPGLAGLPVENVQGTHLELPGKVEHGCYYMEAPQDKRAVFVMPWKNDTTLLGTTEYKYSGDPGAVTPLPEEIGYLLAVYRHYFPGRSTEVLNQWAGLRVLPSAAGGSFKSSRETQLPTDNESLPRVVSIFGGKLTGYRATAQQVMAKLRRTLPPVAAIADTRELRLEPAD